MSGTKIFIWITGIMAFLYAICGIFIENEAERHYYSAKGATYFIGWVILLAILELHDEIKKLNDNRKRDNSYYDNPHY